jgi:hypothetical protein
MVETAISEVPMYTFKVETGNIALAPFTALRLFNGYNEIVGEGYGTLDLCLPKGVYQLRIEMNEHVEDRHYRLDKSVHDTINDLDLASAIPIEGFSTTHEYFEGPSRQWSTFCTRDGKPIEGASTSLFILLRYTDTDKPYEKVRALEKDFYILNESREVVYALNAENTKTHSGQANEFFGTVAFSELMLPGQYYLVYSGRQVKREMPLYVFNGWQTQVFIMCKNFPLFGSLRISIDRNGFTAHSFQTARLDALAQKLYNKIYVLPEPLKLDAAHGKWENPMLGILATYMYLLTDSDNDNNLFNTILYNLQTNILNNTMAPDFVALRLLGALHFKKEMPEEPLAAPTMIATGITAVLQQAIKNENLIPANGLVEQILPKLKGDSAWTTYEPLPFKKPKKVVTKTISSPYMDHIEERNSPLESPKAELGFEPIEKYYSKAPSNPKPIKDWVAASLFSQLLENKMLPDVNTLAAQMQVTPNTIKKTLERMSKERTLNAVASSVSESTGTKFGEMTEMVRQKVQGLLRN